MYCQNRYKIKSHQKYALNVEQVLLRNFYLRIYSVQALNNSSSTSFYRKIAELTGGYHLHLDQFSSIANFLLAICYRECGEEPLRQFEEEVRISGTIKNCKTWS